MPFNLFKTGESLYFTKAGSFCISGVVFYFFSEVLLFKACRQRSDNTFWSGSQFSCTPSPSWKGLFIFFRLLLTSEENHFWQSCLPCNVFTSFKWSQIFLQLKLDMPDTYRDSPKHVCQHTTPYEGCHQSLKVILGDYEAFVSCG